MYLETIYFEKRIKTQALSTYIAKAKENGKHVQTAWNTSHENQDIDCNGIQLIHILPSGG